MAREFISLYDHSFGVNINDATHLLPKNQVRRMKNCHSYELGMVVKRKGISKYNSVAIPTINRMAVGGLFRYYTIGTIDKELITVGRDGSNDQVYVENATEDGFDIMTGGTALTEGGRYSWAVAKDTLFGSNGVQDIFFHERNTTIKADTAGVPPKGGLLEMHPRSQQLYITMDTANPSRVHYTNKGVFTTLPTLLESRKHKF